MNILIVTSPEHEDFIYHALDAVDYRGGLVVIINNKNDYEKFVTSYSYDIGISFMWTHKIPKRELDRATWFNFHPAPLPEYKGRNLCYHAIMNGEKEFGASVHYMDENFDTGDIIKVDKFPINDWWTAGDLSRRTIELAEYQFMHYFPRIIAGEQFERLPNVGGAYYKKEAIDDFLYLTEWNKRRIRAITYGDFCPKVEIGGVTYKIVRDE